MISSEIAIYEVFYYYTYHILRSALTFSVLYCCFKMKKVKTLDLEGVPKVLTTSTLSIVFFRVRFSLSFAFSHCIDAFLLVRE